MNNVSIDTIQMDLDPLTPSGKNLIGSETSRVNIGAMSKFSILSEANIRIHVAGFRTTAGVPDMKQVFSRRRTCVTAIMINVMLRVNALVQHGTSPLSPFSGENAHMD